MIISMTLSPTNQEANEKAIEALSDIKHLHLHQVQGGTATEEFVMLPMIEVEENGDTRHGLESILKYIDRELSRREYSRYFLDGKEYDILKIWTADLKVIVELADESGKMGLVSNGHLIGWFDEIYADNSPFLNGGIHDLDLDALPEYFLVSLGGKWGYVFKDKATKLYRSIGDGWLPRRGESYFAFRAKNDEEKETYVINGKEQGWFNHVFLEFLEDESGMHYAMQVYEGESWHWILDGQPLDKHDKSIDRWNFGKPVYLNGNFAYPVARAEYGEEKAWVVNGRFTDWYKDTKKGFFTENGKFIFYATGFDGKTTFVVDGDPQGWHNGVHFYCHLNENPLRLAFVVKTVPEEEAVCVDGNVGKFYSEVKDIHFAEGVLAYLAKTMDEKWTVVVDQVEGELSDTEEEATHSDRYREYYIRKQESSKYVPGQG